MWILAKRILEVLHRCDHRPEERIQLNELQLHCRGGEIDAGVLQMYVTVICYMIHKMGTRPTKEAFHKVRC